MRTILLLVALALPYSASSFVSELASGLRLRTGLRPRPAVRALTPQMAEQLIVTDGTDSFFASRLVFQSVHDHGDYSKITAFSSSIAESKKMLLSRQARYSGLVDVLTFAEGGSAELAAAFAESTAWIAVNADQATLAEQLSAAEAAGIKRAFIHLSAADCPDTAPLAAVLEGSSVACTLMRTGSLSKTGSGGGLLVSGLDEPTCDEVPIEDVFRFVAEAMTLPEAEGRAFSLCPSADATQLKEMRMAGCSRRDEVKALLKGVIRESVDEELDPTEVAAKAEETAKSEEENKLEREEELKELLARAKQRGIETQARLAEEEKVKSEKRAERLSYFERNQPKDDDEGDSEGEGDAKGGSSDKDKPKKDGDDDDDDDDDRLALV